MLEPHKQYPKLLRGEEEKVMDRVYPIFGLLLNLYICKVDVASRNSRKKTIITKIMTNKRG